MRRFWLPNFAYALAALIFCAGYFDSPWARTYYGSDSHSQIEALTAFRATTPYQYRVLLPLMARAVQLVTPLPAGPIFAVFVAAFAWGSFVGFRRYLSFFLSEKAAALYALGLLFPLWWIYCVFSDFRYPWDIPTVFFFIWGLVLLHQKRWRLYFFVFALGCLNRETGVFLALAYFFTQWQPRAPRRFWILGGAQIGFWLALKTALTAIFAHNPGQKVFEPHLGSNLYFLSDLVLHPVDAEGWLLLSFGWMLAPLFGYWRRQPAFFKHLLLVLPFLFAGMLVVGAFAQLRIWNEAVPILLAPALFGLEVGRQAISSRYFPRK